MANVRYGNTFYIDTQYSSATDELSVKNIKVKSILFNATSSSGSRLLLTDSGNNKIDIRGSSLGGAIYIDYTDSPVIFSNSIRPTTLTSATASLVVEETKA